MLPSSLGKKNKNYTNAKDKMETNQKSFLQSLTTQKGRKRKKPKKHVMNNYLSQDHMSYYKVNHINHSKNSFE